MCDSVYIWIKHLNDVYTNLKYLFKKQAQELYCEADWEWTKENFKISW